MPLVFSPVLINFCTYKRDKPQNFLAKQKHSIYNPLTLFKIQFPADLHDILGPLHIWKTENIAFTAIYF